MPLLRRSLLAAISTFLMIPSARAGFKPPGKAARRAAVGSLDGLAPELQRAFTWTDDDPPIPAPGPGDWLSEHDDDGQTFAQFVRARPNRLGLVRNQIVLLPIGGLGDGAPALKTLIDFANRYFGLPASALPAITMAELRARSRVRGRRQYRTGCVRPN